MRGATAPRLLLEVVCARLLLPSASDTESALLQRVERIETRLDMSIPAAERPQRQPAPPPSGRAPRGRRSAPARGRRPRPDAGRAALPPPVAKAEPNPTPVPEPPPPCTAAPEAGP